MKVYDVCFLPTFEEAERLLTYEELCDFFKRPLFTKQFYDDWNIYYERHHIVPRCEGGKDSEDNLIRVPLFYHFRLHVMRGDESSNLSTKYKNYSAALLIAHQKNGKIRKLFNDSIAVCENKWKLSSGLKYEEIYGDEKALEIKKKLSEKTRLRNLSQSESERKKRKKSIKRYAESRPEAHNKAISESRLKSDKQRKPIICLNDMKIYRDVIECEKNYEVSKYSISYCCQGKFQQVKGHYFQFYDTAKDDDYWRQLYDQKRTNLKVKGWSNYNSKR